MINNKEIATTLTEDVHIYIDDETGDEYIYDGSKLVKIGNKEKPNIGDKGDEDELAKEDEEREQQAKKEREESGEDEETEEERQVRLDKIKNFLNDKNVGDKVSYESEQKVTDERKRKKAAEKREVEKNLSGSSKNASVTKALCKDIGQFLAKTVGKSVRNASWKKYNGNYDGSGIVKQGYRYEKVGHIPVIQIYVDQSGSWDEKEIKIAFDIIRSISEFERKKQIKTEIYYFANHVHSNAEQAREEGGTGAGTELMQQLNSMKPDNVIVITDDDFDGWGIEGSYTAPGGVWLVFRDNRSQKLINQLHGKMLTKYYDIDKIR